MDEYKVWYRDSAVENDKGMSRVIAMPPGGHLMADLERRLIDHYGEPETTVVTAAQALRVVRSGK